MGEGIVRVFFRFTVGFGGLLCAGICRGLCGG